MSVAIRDIPGSGSAVTAGGYVHTWAHGLGIVTPALSLYQLTVASPPQWRLVPPGEYDARFPDGNTVALSVASTPPTPGHVGSLKLIVAGQLAVAPAFDATPSPQGISQAMFRAFLSQATDFVRAFLPTVVRFDADETDVPAARWGLVRSAKSEMSGLLSQCDVAFRVRLEALPEITLKPQSTRIAEDGRVFRVERIRSANGDPAIVLECAAV